MAEEVGIVMSLYDRVSPTLKAIAGNSKAFDKSLDDLEQSLKAYDKAQDGLTKKSADLKKALAEADNQVKAAQKSYKKLNDEASKRDLDEAIDRQAELRRALSETESGLRANSKGYADLYEKARKAAKGINDVAAAASKADNRAEQSGESAAGFGAFSKGLVAAGLGNLVSDGVGQMGSSFLSSAIGEPEARRASSVISGAISGGTMGAVLGPPGIAAGAIIGAGAGALSGASEIFQARDDSFKSYVQESAEGQITARDEAIASGSDIAGGREQKQMAFSTLLGSEQAAGEFLADVKDMAANTNYSYDEITNYAKSLVGPFGADKSLDILTKLSDASAALSLGESDNAVLIAGLSRMQLTDKTTQEYLNYFSERGLDVYEALSAWGDAATVAEKVTKGEIRGSEAVDAILEYIQEEYGGLSEKMAGTYIGMVNNLEDAQANADAAYGEGYNEARKEGIAEQTEWLNSGAMDEASRAIGAWQAELENAKERYIREAEAAAIESEEYQQAKAAGDAAEMGRLIAQARVRGMNEYNASEGAQEALEAEKALVEGIRNNAAANQDYWDAGYERGQWYTKGIAAAMTDGVDVDGITYIPGYGQSAIQVPYTSPESSNAYGLNRVPYDNYAALLHEGERVLTAREAREMDRGGQGGGVTVHITGEWHVSGPEDADAVAEAILRKIKLAQTAGTR